MKKEIITCKKAPKAIGPYSHGNAFGGLIFTSGQLPVDSQIGKIVSGGIVEQSIMALKNLVSVVKAGGGDVETILKTTCYLANIEDFAKFNAVYAEVFGNDSPARSCFAVKDLPMGALVEVEAVAHKL